MFMNNESCISTSVSAEKHSRIGWAPTPVSLIGMLAVLVFFGLTYLADNAGGFNRYVYEPHVRYEELDRGCIFPLTNHGKNLFEMNCAACHGQDGRGSINIMTPPLAGSDWVNEEDPSRIIRIVLNGLSGPITVSGKQYGAAIMIPWRDTLSDEQIATILTYVRGNKNWGNNASAVTPEQIKAIREKTMDKAGPWNVAELLSLPVSH